MKKHERKFMGILPVSPGKAILKHEFYPSNKKGKPQPPEKSLKTVSHWIFIIFL